MSIAGTEEDFKLGYQDAILRRGYRPTSVCYVDGYEKGLAFRRLVDPDPEEDPGPNDFLETCK